jgi:Zn-dependent protease with chaperone function
MVGAFRMLHAELAPEDEEPPWPLIFAAIVAVPEAINLFAFFLHRSRVGSPIPKALEGIYDAKEYEVSNRYTKAKYDLSLVNNLFNIVFTFAFWFLKGFPWLDGIAVSFGLSTIPTGIVFFALYGLIFYIVELPFELYSTFVLEESFGFNKTTPWTFVKDRLKALVLVVLIGTPVLYAVLWFFETFHSHGWLYVFLTVTGVQLVMLFLMPVLILPLFMEMIPLPEGTAFVSDEVEKGGSSNFLSARVFYEDELQNGKPSYTTKDRRFAGTSTGAQLSIYSSADQSWVVADGAPGDNGTVYATCNSRAADGPGSSSVWTLSETAKNALKNDDEQSTLLSQDGGASDSINMTRVDVGALRKRLLELSDKLGYAGASIFVIDGSSRSSHSNAFCMGFGRFRRICLYDTLLPLMTEDEIIAVLGHEIGHDRLYHVHTTLVITIIYMAIQFYFLGQFISSEVIAHAFFVPRPEVYLGLALFSVVWSVVDFVFSIPLTVQTRMNEYAADRYSVDADISHSVTLGSGLKKLMKKSKANLTPHWLYVFMTYSHPPLDVRLEAIEKYADEKKRK